MNSSQTIPVGEIVTPMARGQITIPAKYRRKLKIDTNTPLNVFEWRGMIIVVPVKVTPYTIKYTREEVNWQKDTPEEYMRKVRYNPLEELWIRMAIQR